MPRGLITKFLLIDVVSLVALPFYWVVEQMPSRHGSVLATVILSALLVLMIYSAARLWLSALIVLIGLSNLTWLYLWYALFVAGRLFPAGELHRLACGDWKPWWMIGSFLVVPSLLAYLYARSEKPNLKMLALSYAGVALGAVVFVAVYASPLTTCVQRI